MAPVATMERFTAAELDANTVRRRAIEAVIWGMPAVNYDLMLQEALRIKGGANQVVYWSRPLDWKNQTLTPNPDSIYLMVFFDTQDAGPMVIDVPPADGGSFAGNICTVWQMPLEDVGPHGADEGRGGKYLILPPGYKDRPPPGTIALRSDTFGGFVLLRANLASHGDADVAQSVAYGKRVRIYPLSRAASPGQTTFTDATGVVFDATIPYDLRFFRSLHRVIQREPWLERDRAMIDPLKSIGIERGKPFSPDARRKELLTAAAHEAKALLEEHYDRGFPPYFPGSRWSLPMPPDLVDATRSSYGDAQEYPIDSRGLAYSYAFVGIKRLGSAQFYLLSIKDRDGDALDGGKTYRLTVPPHPPVQQYWSATAYDRATHALIRDVPRASRSSQISDLRTNGDGSIDLYFGARAPAGQGPNWVPTKAGGRFEILFRLYGPEKALFDKTWTLPDLEKVG
jgi:hypothetical protein